MDLLTGAGVFAQIVGLMADFAATRGHRDTLELKEFLEWLSRGHGKLKALIEQSHGTSVGIKAALSEGSAKVLERLTALEALLASASLSQGPLGQVAMSVVPTRVLSDQQLCILGAYESNRAGRAILNHGDEGAELLFIDGEGNGGYGASEPRFFETELSGLVRLGLLKLSTDGRGDPLYGFTRTGSAIARMRPAR